MRTLKLIHKPRLREFFLMLGSIREAVHYLTTYRNDLGSVVLMPNVFTLLCFLLVSLTGCVISIGIERDEEASSSVSTVDKRVVPEVLKIQDNVARTMLNYSPNDELGIVKMVAPIGWTEPVRSIGFDIRGIIISGTLGLEFENETLKFDANDGFFIPRNTKVRIHNAGDGELHMVEVFTPNYKPNLVTDFEGF